MNIDKRKALRDINGFLGKKVVDKGTGKFGNEKFSFKDLTIVERDDRIHAYRGLTIAEIARIEKMSCRGVYDVLAKKMK